MICLKLKTIASASVGLLLVSGVAIYIYLTKLYINVPDYPPVTQSYWLDQGWTLEERKRFHHFDQGTQTLGIPYEWFVALEQPRITFFGDVGRLNDPVYLDRFGFIPGSTRGGEVVPPIGFAKSSTPTMIDWDGKPWRNPRSQDRMHAIGFTCAACHTGRLTYKGKAVLIDGGAALTDLGTFRQAVGISVLYTIWIPGRFARFANNVLGEGAGEASKQALKQQLEELWDKRLNALRLFDQVVAKKHVEEGFGRLDALNRIGNQVFAVDLDKEGLIRNYNAATAPVNYPHLWSSPWFDWVQYNSSIRQPMVRNAGQALGVGAPLNLFGPGDERWRTSVQVGSLHEIEGQLAGRRPYDSKAFSGLLAPRWPAAVKPDTVAFSTRSDERATSETGQIDRKDDQPSVELFPVIDRDPAKEGGKLYKEHCAGCHRPPIGSAEFWTKNWIEVETGGLRVLTLKVLPVEKIGTDPAQAEDMKTRTVWVPDWMNLGIGHGACEFASALGEVVAKAVEHWYDNPKHREPPEPDKARTPEAVKDEMNGYRPNEARSGIPEDRARKRCNNQTPSKEVAGYKARPLDGVWATPPFLHNGSVPNIYALLSPVGERPDTFKLGRRDYDPVCMGYRMTAPEVLDVRVPKLGKAEREANDVKACLDPTIGADRDRLDGLFSFDACKRGNWNTGHAFGLGKKQSDKECTSPPDRTIGLISQTALEPHERLAIIEFLKTDCVNLSGPSPDRNAQSDTSCKAIDYLGATPDPAPR